MKANEQKTFSPSLSAIGKWSIANDEHIEDERFGFPFEPPTVQSNRDEVKVSTFYLANMSHLLLLL